MEHVDDVAHIKRNHAQKHIAQGIVDNGKREGKRAYLECREPYVDDRDKGCQCIAYATGNGKAQGSIQKVTVHHVGCPLQPPVHAAVFQSLLDNPSFLLVHWDEIAQNDL